MFTTLFQNFQVDGVKNGMGLIHRLFWCLELDNQNKLTINLAMLAAETYLIEFSEYCWVL